MGSSLASSEKLDDQCEEMPEDGALLDGIAITKSGRKECLGARVMPKESDDSKNGHIAAMYPLYERAKHGMARLLEQLASGPSDGGGGH
ncbi:hypothetical protein KSS87_005410 [Heliosperma pusillum]|nr:hypothetical protein KSS87_005410 [Heliosperma pusillum]